MLGLELDQFADPGFGRRHGPYDEVPTQVLFAPEPLLEKDVILVTDDMLQKRGFGKLDRLDFQVIPADKFQILVDTPDAEVHALGPVPFH